MLQAENPWSKEVIVMNIGAGIVTNTLFFFGGGGKGGRGSEGEGGGGDQSATSWCGEDGLRARPESPPMKAPTPQTLIAPLVGAL